MAYFGGEPGSLDPMMASEPHPQLNAAGMDCDEDMERTKQSRWQIRSGALSVLEQVYAVEPFPGLETRRELSRKLNVSVRQVQVWFQNKRQRERKISRAKGLLSTPGLPDTPATTAAAADRGRERMTTASA